MFCINLIHYLKYEKTKYREWSHRDRDRVRDRNRDKDDYRYLQRRINHQVIAALHEIQEIRNDDNTHPLNLYVFVLSFNKLILSI